MRYIIEICPAVNGEWFWHVKAPNGQIIVASETYTRRWSAKRGASKMSKMTGWEIVTITVTRNGETR